VWTAFYLKKSVKKREKKREKKRKGKRERFLQDTIPIVLNRMSINTSLLIGGEVLAFAVW